MIIATSNTLHTPLIILVLEVAMLLSMLMFWGAAAALFK